MLRNLLRTSALLTMVAIPLACDSGTDPIPPADIDLFAEVDVLPAGQSTQLAVQVLDSDGDVIMNPDVDYETSSAALATVNDNGVVTGVGHGEVTITATAGAFSDQVSMFIFDFDDPCSQALFVPLNTPVRASLDQGDCTEIVDDDSYVDLWYFELTQDLTVTIDMVSSDFNAYMWLIDEEGFDVATDDNSGTDDDARIIETLPAGTYYILANHLPPEHGIYTLSVSTGQTADPALLYGRVETRREAPGIRFRR